MTMMCMAALLVMAVSCKKEKTGETYSGEGFQATTESHTGDGDSKTQLLSDLNVSWCAGDEIKVFSSTDSDGKKFSAANAGTTADFNPVDAVTDAFFSPAYRAFYPYSAAIGTNQITLPGTQHYTVTDGVLTFASGENPMAAHSASKVLPFKNLCGILKFQLYSTTSCTVKSLCVTTLKPGEQLWGTGTVTFEGTEASLGTLANGGESIILDCDNGVLLSTDESQPTDFFVVIPDGALSEGFKVTVTETGPDGKIWSRTADVSNTITKSKIKAMPIQEVATHKPVTPESVTIAAGCGYPAIFNLGGTVTVPTDHEYDCEFGIVYTTEDHEPTVADTKVVAGTATFSGERIFVVDLIDFTPGLNYRMRAYAIIEGVKYSSVKTVDGGNVPLPLASNWINGRSPKDFSVSDSKKVYFSQGNLQYNAAGSSDVAAPGQNVNGTWRFAGLQASCLGDVNKQAAQTYQGWTDLFCWGTSGYNHGAHCYQPWSRSQMDGDYWAYGSSGSHLYDSDRTADWGHNFISNGSTYNWRTLTEEEWQYLIDRKDNNGALLYGLGKLGSCTPGMIILPDDWVPPTGVPDFIAGNSDWSNLYTYSEWVQMEAAGAVFLPAAGCILSFTGTWFGGGVRGNYWSSSYKDDVNAIYLFFNKDDAPIVRGLNRSYGYSVRLVTDAN